MSTSIHAPAKAGRVRKVICLRPHPAVTACHVRDPGLQNRALELIGTVQDRPKRKVHLVRHKLSVTWLLGNELTVDVEADCLSIIDTGQVMGPHREGTVGTDAPRPVFRIDEEAGPGHGGAQAAVVTQIAIAETERPLIAEYVRFIESARRPICPGLGKAARGTKGSSAQVEVESAME